MKVVAHNTLVASDYGLLSEKTLAPKPNYWAALLWRRLMAPTVLDSGVPIHNGLHVYAHCLKAVPGGVAVLAINNSRTRRSFVDLPLSAHRYTLTSQRLESGDVQLNGQELKLGADDHLPLLKGERIPAGLVALPPTSITFLAISDASNTNCR